MDELATIETVNARLELGERAARLRAKSALRPGEIALLSRYRSELAGEVLELGCRGDGLTDWLAYNAWRFTGLGMSAASVALCRDSFAEASFLTDPITALERFDDGQFHAIVAGRQTLDALVDHQRRQVLEEMSRILAPDGVIIFSSHNLSCESLVQSPLRYALTHPLTFWRLPRALRNRRRLARLQQREFGYAMLNNAAEDFGRLSYYISRDAQERQLADCDLALHECSTLWDEPVGAGQHAYRRHELYYVAQPVS